MKDPNWISFADEVGYLRAPSLPSSGMVPIYHTRESYIEDLFEGMILVPRRTVIAELQYPTFSFVPPQYPRRLIKHTSYHFLSQPIRKFAQLTCENRNHWYMDSERKDHAGRGEKEILVTLRVDILFSYCDHHRFVPIFVIDAYRFSERTLDEGGLSAGRTDTSDTKFSYFLQFGPNSPHSRPRMRSFSLLCGKCLLPNPA